MDESGNVIRTSITVNVVEETYEGQTRRVAKAVFQTSCYGRDNFHLKACMAFDDGEVENNTAPDSFIACRGPSLELATAAHLPTVWRRVWAENHRYGACIPIPGLGANFSGYFNMTQIQQLRKGVWVRE